MSVKAVLFDLDGTLLPMDQDVFVKTYFKGLSKKLAPRGYDPEKLIKAIWVGTDAMIKNNGEDTNEEVFWNLFGSIFGEKARDDEPYFDEFYRTDFQAVKEICDVYKEAPSLIKGLKEKGIRVALATNPIFPKIATESRTKWAGLDIGDFELYTTYENCRYSKPNPKYYTDIIEKMGLKPDECIMVGNDVSDDMVAKGLGMGVFLLTDNLINKTGEDITQYPNGNFSDLIKFLENI